MSRKPIVVALLARAGHGKSTAAMHITIKCDGALASFAYPLKQMAGSIWGFDPDQLYGPAEIKEVIDPRWNMSPRLAMQRLGSSAREFIGREVWVESCINRILMHKAPLTVIEDCRYPNEAFAIARDARFDGYVIKLVCPDANSKADPNHPSEAMVDKVDDCLLHATITSRKSPNSQDLKDKIDRVMEDIHSSQKPG